MQQTLLENSLLIGEWKEKYPNCCVKIENNELIINKKLHISKARKKHEKQNCNKLNLDQLNNINNIYTKQINIPVHTKVKKLSKQDELQRQRMYELSRVENIGKKIYNRNMNHPDDFSGWRDRGIYIGTGSNGVPIVKYGDYRIKHGGSGIKHISLTNAQLIQNERKRMNTHKEEKMKLIEVIDMRTGAENLKQDLTLKQNLK